MNLYRGFIFDADNTLFDFTRCSQEALFETMELYRLLPHSALRTEVFQTFHLINEGLWNQLEQSQLSLEQVRQNRFEQLFTHYAVAVDNHTVDTVSQFYVEALSRKAYLMPHAVQVLEQLSHRAVLALITNGISEVQKSRLARAELEVFFQTIIISEEAGISKPNPQIFTLAATQMHLAAGEILAVGDSLSSDIGGGQSAGMHACWYNPQHLSRHTDTVPDLEISDLRELLALTREAD